LPLHGEQLFTILVNESSQHMYEAIYEKISVLSLFDHEKGVVIPKKIRWKGRIYTIIKLSYHHKIRQGQNLLHIFHVTDGVMDFRLRLDTHNLHWMLEEISDGTSS